MSELKIGVIGAAGRMGGAVIRQVAETEGCAVVAASEVQGSPAIGRDAGEVAGLGTIGVAITGEPRVLFNDAEAVIEFSTPAATIDHVHAAAEARCIHVIGTTGLDADQEKMLAPRRVRISGCAFDAAIS